MRNLLQWDPLFLRFGNIIVWNILAQYFKFQQSVLEAIRKLLMHFLKDEAAFVRLFLTIVKAWRSPC